MQLLELSYLEQRSCTLYEDLLKSGSASSARRGVLDKQAERFQTITKHNFSFFEESLKRTLIICEGFPRLNALQPSDNVMQALVSLTERNHELFLTQFIEKLIALVEQHRSEQVLDSSLLHALLQV